MTPDFSAYREIIPYARYSSRRQARGTSEARQQDAVDRWAQTHGLTLSSRRCIDRGLSGFDGSNVSRGALGRLITDLRDGLIPTPSLLVVERQDRFGRRPNTQALVSVLSDLLERGCDLYHLSIGRLYSSAIVNSDFGALVTLAAEIHAAHQHSSLLSDRCMAAHERARQRMASGEAARIGWAPCWISWAADGWQLNDYSTTVRTVLQLLDAGHGMISTARLLNRDGLLSPRGKAWTQGSVGHILNSEALAGGRELKRRTGEVVWGYWPAVIEREDLEALRRRVSSRSTTLPAATGKVGYIGQGITVCTCGSPCGYRSSSNVQQGKRSTTAYLRCRGRVNGTCEQPALRLLPVHRHLLSRLEPGMLQELLRSLQDQQGIEQLRETVQMRQQVLQRAKVERDNVAAAVRKAARNGTLLEVLAAELATCEQQMVQLEQQLQSAADNLAAAERQVDLGDANAAMRAFGRAFATGTDTVEQRRAVNQQLMQLGLQVTVDAARERIGLSLADGSIQWGTLAAADGAALWSGASLTEVGGLLVEREPDRQQYGST